MKPQPTTLEAKVMTCPTASGARMLVTWSIRLMVAFIPFVKIRETDVNVLPPGDFEQNHKTEQYQIYPVRQTPVMQSLTWNTGPYAH